MRGLSAWAGGLVVALAGPAAADDFVGPPAPAPVEQLIEQLGSRDYRVREAAGRTLEARGEDALPVLRKSVATADPEIRRRLALLTQNIDRKVMLSAKRVSLHLKDKPLKEAISSLSQQTGYKIDVQENGNQPQPRLTLNLDHVSFWAALEKLCLVAGLTIQMNDGQEGIQLYFQDTFSPYVHHSGPFRFVAGNFQYNNNINLNSLPRRGIDTNQDSETLMFYFMINPEPKLPLLGIGQPKLTEALDDRGQSMMFPQPVDQAQELEMQQAFYRGNNGYRSWNQQASINLLWPTKEARTLKSIKGSLPVTLLSEQRPDVVVENLLKVKNKKYAGKFADIEVDSATENNRQVQITIQIKRSNNDTFDPNDASWNNTIQQRLEVQDAKGNKYYSQGITNYINSQPNMIHATFSFMGNVNGAQCGPPTKMIYYHWVSLPHQVDFEFKDLPLPRLGRQ
jgi:hypothetical protein